MILASTTSDTAVLLETLHFAAVKHQDQRRKNIEATPYINHPIAVAKLLVDEGQVTDLVTLQAAILHDTLEDTNTTATELEEHFGATVRQVVEEVTDDKRLPKEERKRLQIEHAPHLSSQAKPIKIADKISNVQDMITSPPVGWPLERRLAYLDWSEQVIAGCRGSNPPLEALYDQVLRQGRQQLAEA
ncbi:MAG: bifunctional (p)ppGpp synthetase/guanosine-3',5'-bis(diphosphate) 3'-pyrophosphohydrolase [Leptolyngbya sp. LCM1.Bin17]|nr:MAG: bifunctional (p)ppGpp synthetase/guanosine-3',5'-bis(diphosphate) 3'-pyrophosphohydrolase [Leptolyngbya sp. LCM1.Bin17]